MRFLLDKNNFVRMQTAKLLSALGYVHFNFRDELRSMLFAA